jgi:hypothetical protein
MCFGLVSLLLVAVVVFYGGGCVVLLFTFMLHLRVDDSHHCIAHLLVMGVSVWVGGCCCIYTHMQLMG